jgi:hypothetical protein
MLVEKKGVDSYKVNDYNNYIFLSNNVQPLSIEMSDRRYLALDLSNEKAGDLAYFETLCSSFTDQCGEHFYHFLAGRDITNFRVQHIPNTEFKTELKMRGAPLPIVFLFELLDGEIDYDQIIDPEDETRDTMRASVKTLYDMFSFWMTENGIHHRINSIGFAKEIGKYLTPSRFYAGDKQVRGYVCSFFANKKEIGLPISVIGQVDIDDDGHLY